MSEANLPEVGQVIRAALWNDEDMWDTDVTHDGTWSEMRLDYDKAAQVVLDGLAAAGFTVVRATAHSTDIPSSPNAATEATP